MAKRKKQKKKSQYQWVYTGPPKSKNVAPETTTLAPASPHQQFADLQKDRQWLLRQIKRKRTELNNFIEGVRSLASEVLKHSADPMQRLQELDTEIHALFEEIFTKRKFGKQSRRDIERVYRQLQRMGVISFKSDGEQDPDDFDFEMPPFEFDEEGQGPDPDFGQGQNPFQRQPEPTADTPNRDMRQTFLRLAAIYHPDRAEDEDTQAIHTEIMKELNRAYKEGDFARLLELEKQQQSGELDSEELGAGDDLERACQKLERENATLREQYEGIKTELRNLRNGTQEGQMLTAYRRAKRAGIDMFEQMAEEADEEIEQIEEIRDFVRDFRDRKLTIKDFLKGPSGGAATPSPEEMMMALEDLLGVRVGVYHDDF